MQLSQHKEAVAELADDLQAASSRLVDKAAVLKEVQSRIDSEGSTKVRRRRLGECCRVACRRVAPLGLGRGAACSTLLYAALRLLCVCVCSVLCCAVLSGIVLWRWCAEPVVCRRCVMVFELANISLPLSDAPGWRRGTVGGGDCDYSAYSCCGGEAALALFDSASMWCAVLCVGCRVRNISDHCLSVQIDPRLIASSSQLVTLNGQLESLETRRNALYEKQACCCCGSCLIPSTTRNVLCRLCCRVTGPQGRFRNQGAARQVPGGCVLVPRMPRCSLSMLTLTLTLTLLWCRHRQRVARSNQRAEGRHRRRGEVEGRGRGPGSRQGGVQERARGAAVAAQRRAGAAHRRGVGPNCVVCAHGVGRAVACGRVRSRGATCLAGDVLCARWVQQLKHATELATRRAASRDDANAQLAQARTDERECSKRVSVCVWRALVYRVLRCAASLWLVARGRFRSIHSHRLMCTVDSAADGHVALQIEASESQLQVLNRRLEKSFSPAISAGIREINHLRDVERWKGVYGTLLDLLSTEPQYNTVVEVRCRVCVCVCAHVRPYASRVVSVAQIIGGKQLLNMVVDTDETAARCIEHLKRTNRGVFAEAVVPCV